MSYILVYSSTSDVIYHADTVLQVLIIGKLSYS